MDKSSRLVTLYPTGTAYIGGVEAIEQEVSAARAKELLAYRPAAFTTDPKLSVANTPLYLTHSPDIPPDSPSPADPVIPQGPPDGGPLDSPEV